MKKSLVVLLMLYLVALHCSIALMEFTSWTAFLLIVVEKIRRRERLEFPLWPYISALVGVVLVSTLVHHEYKPFWFQFGYMRWTVLFYSFYWALSEVWEESFERRLLTLWNILIVIVGAYATLQCFTGIDLIRPGVQRVDFEQWGIYHDTGYFAMKATAFFSLSLTFGYVLGISSFAAGSPSLAQPQLRRWVPITAVGALAGLFATQSRGTWISTLLCALIWFGAEKPKRFFQLAGAGVAAFVVAFFASSSFHDRVLSIHPDHSGMMRVDLWQAYGQMFKENPLLGIGLLQGDKLLPEYYAKLGIIQPFVSHAHNVYLQWAAGSGIFALLLYLVISILMLEKAWRLRKVSPWGIGLFTGQLFLHFGAFTECNFFDAEVLHMMVFTWAITLALTAKLREPVRA